MLYCHLQHHNDTIIKTQEDFFINICTSHFIVRVRKGLLKVCNILTPTLMAVRVVSFLFSWCSTGGPGPTLLDDGFLYCILSASSLEPNSSGPQAPSAWCDFPYHVSSITPTPTVTGTGTVTLSWLSYIIVQRALDRLLDLWNGMIDRHPAEITVMQFTGHSLPVHQSMSVSWALPCPISSANFRPRDFLS